MIKRTKEATNEMAKEKASMTVGGAEKADETPKTEQAIKTEQAQTDKQDGNREVVSDTFSLLMEYPEYALDVYNALNGSHYDDPAVVQIVTLKQGISLTVRNDASFIIGRRISFYEHQSTYNPNMPLRHAIYYFDYLKRWVKDNDIDLYGKKRVMIPTPHFVVFYNGVESRPDIEEMMLSTSFYPVKEESEKALEVKCKVYNINLGRNSWLAESSKIIKGYGIFVDKIRSYRKTEMELGDAIDHAIDDCIKENILRRFFVNRRDEVRNAMQLDFTWERREQLIRKEEFTDGKIEGKIEDILEILGEHGEVPQELKNEIGLEKDPEVLTKMLKMAAQAKSIEDFRAKLEEMKCCL